MLELSLTGKEERWITNNDKCFEDTPYALHSFRVKIKPITRLDISRAMKANTKVVRNVQSTNDILMQRDLFVFCVVEWEGIADSNKQTIECNDKNKAAIADSNVGFSSLVVEQAIGYHSELDEKTESEVGN